jgi:hypothetical protein
MVVLLMLLEMGLQLSDTRRQERNLYVGRPGILLVDTARLDELGSHFLRQGHARFPPSLARRLFVFAYDSLLLVPLSIAQRNQPPASASSIGGWESELINERDRSRPDAWKHLAR